MYGMTDTRRYGFWRWIVGVISYQEFKILKVITDHCIQKIIRREYQFIRRS